jgi:hypothetical protein
MKGLILVGVTFVAICVGVAAHAADMPVKARPLPEPPYNILISIRKPEMNFP